MAASVTPISTPEFADTRQLEPDPPSSPATAKRRPARAIAATLTVVLLVAAVALALRPAHTPRPEGLSDPVATGETVLVPDPSLQRRPALSAAASSQPDATPAPTPPAPAQIAAASPPQTTTERLMSAITDLVSKDLKHLVAQVEGLAAGQREQQEQLQALKGQLDQLTKQHVAAPPAPRRVSAVRAPVPKPAPSPVPPQERARLLAVDMWDGKPSAVISYGAGADVDVRFFSEGETRGDTTLRKADMRGQRAVFSTERGDVVIARDPE